MKRKKRKVYVYSGYGMFLGSTVIVIANDLEEAQILISAELAVHGLERSEKHDTVEEHQIKNGTIFVNDGDY